MMVREEYYLKEEIRCLKKEIRRQKRQLEHLEKELKYPAGFKEGILTDREKMVLHYSCTATIAKLTDLSHRDLIVEQMIEDIRKNRCRSLGNDDIANLLKAIDGEMIMGTILMKALMKRLTGYGADERPNKRFGTGWSDMK